MVSEDQGLMLWWEEGVCCSVGWMHPRPTCSSSHWISTGFPYSQKERQYTFFFSSLLPQGKIKAVPLMYTKMRNIFAMLLSHLQRHFFRLLQPLSNLLICTSYFHLDLAEDQGFGGCQVKKKKEEKKGKTGRRKGREDPCLCAKQGKDSSIVRSASAQC